MTVDFSNKSISKSLDITTKILQNGSENSDLLHKVSSLFGSRKHEKLQNIIKEISHNLEVLTYNSNLDLNSKISLNLADDTILDLQIVSQDIISADAAFGNNIIYLSEQFLEQNIAQPNAIANVVLEELGHFIDSQLNTVDSQGDEGELFASLIQNQQPTEARLIAMKSEDDSATLTLKDETTIKVEQSSHSDFLPAFPGAEGFGAASIGGRGGKVIEVTNLNDSGPGSFREALDADGPRIVVFKVGGTIELDSSLKIENPYITIAGQTAPGGGITLKNSEDNPEPEAPLKIKTHDVILRYISSRPGASDADDGNIDALNIIEGSGSEVFNVVVDHTSLSWSTDEVASIIEQVQDVSIQWNIISEGLDDSTNPEGPHSMGLLMYKEGQGNISVHHNLIAHNRRRNPLVKTTDVVDIVNNVIYNPGFGTDSFSPTHIRGEYGLVPVNYVNNYFKAGADTGTADWFIDTKMEPVEVYVEGNIVPQDVMHPDSVQWIVQQRHAAPYVTTTSAQEAYNRVLAQAGSSHGVNPDGTFFLRRDDIDARIVKDVKQTTGSIIDDPSQVGGWLDIAPGTPYVDTDRDGMADVFENLYGFQMGDSSDNIQDSDGDGYTNIEEFLNGTNPVGNSTVTDPPEFSRIYVSSSSGGRVEDISFRDEDILSFDTASETWSLYVDGSDIGLGASSADIGAFHLDSDGSILLSLNATFTLPDVGSVDENDIVRFIPSSTGTNTAGTYELYLDGSDVGLTSIGEDIDAIAFTPDDRLIISTKGSVNVTGVGGKDEDFLLVFDATSLGESSSGTWSLLCLITQMLV